MPNILSETQKGLLIVIIDRPGKLNALNKATLNELHEVAGKAAADPDIKGMIITGAGKKAFAAGADIAEFSGFTAEEGTALAREGQEKVFDLLESFPKPVVAAINGYALGGGLELALACHMRVASANARLGFPEVSLGLIPGYGGTQRATQLAGKGKAMELILTGRMIEAEEAWRVGLVNHTVGDADDLIPFCEQLFEDILDKAPLALKAAIKCINESMQGNGRGFQTEIEEFGKLFGTEDFREGSRAFLEKRKPLFTGK